MTTTQPTPARKTSSKSSKARPVTSVLLELAYYMHATRAVATRETPAPRRNDARSN